MLMGDVLRHVSASFDDNGVAGAMVVSWWPYKQMVGNWSKRKAVRMMVNGANWHFPIRQ